MSFDRTEYLEKAASQRAALMALVSNIIDTSEDRSLTDIKLMISNTFGKMIDNKIMVGDDIEQIVLKEIREFLYQERAFRAANDIINPDKPL
jgi:hypothetical protein